MSSFNKWQLKNEQDRIRREIEHKRLRTAGENIIIKFKNQIQMCLWNDMLTGQISDGMWENTSNTGWQFWCNAKSELNENVPTHIVGNRTWNVKYNFNFLALIEYVGDEMLEMGKKYDPNYDLKKLRQDLREIKTALKEFKGE